MKDGAILIRNGLVVEAGTSRRVENLKGARNAREIDAGGKIVLPAFVDPDAVLVHPVASRVVSQSPEVPAPDRRLCLISKHRLAQTSEAARADWVRSGVLSVGAHTGFAADLRDSLRILRIHQTMQRIPLRIRSIYAPVPGQGSGSMALEKIRLQKLAAVMELSLPNGISSGYAGDLESGLGVIRKVAIAAAEFGYGFRVRISGVPPQEMLALALETAAIALIAPPAAPGAGLRELIQLADHGCVHVFGVTAALQDDWNGAEGVRREIDEGIPVAIASGFRPPRVGSLNPQFLLYLAASRCGMTAEEAIVAATYNAACSLRISRVTGSLEPGKAADLLVMDVPDYHDLLCRVGHNDVQFAMREGKVVYRRSPLTLD